MGNPASGLTTSTVGAPGGNGRSQRRTARQGGWKPWLEAMIAVAVLVSGRNSSAVAAEPLRVVPPSSSATGAWAAKGSSAPARATVTRQHSRSLAQSVDSRLQAAQPAVLRWRSPSVAHVASAPAGTTASSAPATTVTAIGSQPRSDGPAPRIVLGAAGRPARSQHRGSVQHAGGARAIPSPSHPIRLVDNEVRLDRKDDPFSDPFGDRKNGSAIPNRDHTDRAVRQTPINAETFAPATDRVGSLTDLESSQVGHRATDAGTAAGSPSSPPAILPGAEELPPASTTQSLAAFDLAPSRPAEEAAAEPCDREYNERDCCADEKRCRTARDRWLHDSISKISLDITPGFKPEAEDPYEEEAERNRALARTPVRIWRDRHDQPLATGRVTNIKRGRLLVLDEANEVVKVPFDDLSDDDLCFLTAWWGVPTECSIGDEHFAERNWQPMTFTWKASGLCHKPLFFEEVQLERYGHTAGPLRQPILSGAHFFLNLVTIPYQSGIHPPWECQYTLGYYRPGSCAPWLVPPIPLSVRGGLMEAGAWVGGIYLFP